LGRAVRPIQWRRAERETCLSTLRFSPTWFTCCPTGPSSRRSSGMG
jgi:hypothetical protein